MNISEKDLLDLIHFARRYCDNRKTPAPNTFNKVYDRIVHVNPTIKEKDKIDETLKDKGKFWPYAQDGSYKDETGYFDARR